jgi:hypothetical protein
MRHTVLALIEEIHLSRNELKKFPSRVSQREATNYVETYFPTV